MTAAEPSTTRHQKTKPKHSLSYKSAVIVAQCATAYATIQIVHLESNFAGLSFYADVNRDVQQEKLITHCVSSVCVCVHISFL